MNKRGRDELYEEVIARKTAKRDEEEAKWANCAPPTEGINDTVARLEEAVRNAPITKDGLKLQLVFFDNRKLPNPEVLVDPWWASVCKWHKECGIDAHNLYYKFAKPLLQRLEAAWKEKHPKFIVTIYEGFFTIKTE